MLYTFGMFKLHTPTIYSLHSGGLQLYTKQRIDPLSQNQRTNFALTYNLHTKPSHFDTEVSLVLGSSTIKIW